MSGTAFHRAGINSGTAILNDVIRPAAIHAEPAGTGAVTATLNARSQCMSQKGVAQVVNMMGATILILALAAHVGATVHNLTMWQRSPRVVRL
jgi:hypothetical protein